MLQLRALGVLHTCLSAWLAMAECSIRWPKDGLATHTSQGTRFPSFLGQISTATPYDIIFSLMLLPGDTSPSV